MFKNLSKITTFDKLQETSDNLYQTYISNGGEFPNEFDDKFLITDKSNLLKKKYSFPGLPMESLIDIKQCKFIKKFLNLNPKIFTLIINDDSSIPEYMFQTLSDNLINILDRIDAIQDEIDEELNTLFGSDSSWSSYLVDKRGFDEWYSSERLVSDFLKNFISIMTKIISYYKNIFGNNPVLNYPGINKINQYYQSKKNEIEEEAQKPTKKSFNERIYKNSIQQIFEFALIDKESQRNFYKSLNEFKKMHNPFNTEPEGRKIRASIAQLYWNIFKQVFIRNQKESISPLPVKLMLTFGFLDETLLEENQITELHELVCKKEEITDIPIFFEEEFLKKIYNNEENPSITDMGLSYESYLKEEKKHKKRSKKDFEFEIEDENLKKFIYEVDHRLSYTVAVCSGSTATAFPLLTTITMKGNPKNFYTSKKKLESIINSLKEIDFSVFYRETAVKLDDAREIIQEEIIPNFILLPSFGSKSMFWQDLDGTNRKTKGRIVIPILFMGDLLKSIAYTFACFRWELNRTIKGGMWADPVEGGITGAYFDYVNFYQKNPKLSAETKAKIKEKFKSIRTNRDRFADDYMKWMLFEKDGIMRLNNVTREIFLRYVPFEKKIRAKLENMPAFTEIATKYKNIQEKSISSYERKFKKYMNNDNVLPAPLQKYMDFLNL